MVGGAPGSRGRTLKTAAAAAASGYSVQQVRDLERLGVIPAAHRAANGYREFSDEHLLALRAYRNLAAAVGPVKARHALREMRRLPPDQAAALINSFHVSLAMERDEAIAAQHALDLISAEIHIDPAETDSMTISELAEALRVRPSTLRFVPPDTESPPSKRQCGRSAGWKNQAMHGRHFDPASIRLRSVPSPC